MSDSNIATAVLYMSQENCTFPKEQVNQFEQYVCNNCLSMSEYLFMFDLRLYVPVNSYGQVQMVSSPNHSFFPRQA